MRLNHALQRTDTKRVVRQRQIKDSAYWNLGYPKFQDVDSDGNILLQSRDVRVERSLLRNQGKMAAWHRMMFARQEPGESGRLGKKSGRKIRSRKLDAGKSCDAPVHASRQHFCCAGQFQRQQVRLDGGDVETAAYGKRIGIDGIETHCVQQLRAVVVERG